MRADQALDDVLADPETHAPVTRATSTAA